MTSATAKTRKCEKRCAKVGAPGAVTALLLVWTGYCTNAVALPLWAECGKVPVWAGRALWGVGAAVYGVLWVLAATNYARCALTDNSPAANPPLPPVSDDVIEEHPACAKCGGVKPVRCHHCSVCDRCCLKMDHHCPFVGNCVGFFNQKFFVNFLLCTSGVCLIAFLSAAPLLVILIGDRTRSVDFFTGVHIGIHSLVAFSFIASVGSLFAAHCRYVLDNETTLEAKTDSCCEPSPGNPFNLGHKDNWRLVYGPNWLLWFLPVFSSIGDGYSHPTTTIA